LGAIYCSVLWLLAFVKLLLASVHCVPHDPEFAERVKVVILVDLTTTIQLETESLEMPPSGPGGDNPVPSRVDTNPPTAFVVVLKVAS
jgi:hypothetical protein